MPDLRYHLWREARQSTTRNDELDHNPEITARSRGLQHDPNHLQVTFPSIIEFPSIL
jgi:hypothetical protein